MSHLSTLRDTATQVGVVKGTAFTGAFLSAKSRVVITLRVYKFQIIKYIWKLLILIHLHCVSKNDTDVAHYNFNAY